MMVLLSALSLVVLAAPTVGFRMPVVARGAYAGARFVAVEDFGGPFIAEGTVRGQGTLGPVGLAAELVTIGGVSPRWSDLSLGNAAIEVRGVFGHDVHHGIGLRATFALGYQLEPDSSVAYWGSVPPATLPMSGLALFWEAAAGPWAWRLHAGLRVESYWAFYYTGRLFDLGAIVTRTVPLGGAWELVGELEVLNEVSPLHLRGLARREFGAGWRGDLGLAAPVPGVFVAPSLQVLVQVGLGGG